MNADPNKRRKRKKTRGERNLLYKPAQPPEQNKQDHAVSGCSKKTKSAGTSQRTTYTLRSGKGTCLSLFPKSLKNETKGTITQGRLIGVGIANAKASQWATRVGSENINKQVDEDMRKMFGSVDQDTKKNCNAVETYSKQAVSHSQSTGDEAMEVDLIEKSPEPVAKKEAQALPAAQDTFSKTTPATSGIGSAKSRLSFGSDTSDSAEQLEFSPNVQGIADSILKELRPKFRSMFPSRSLRMETHAEIRKLLNQSTIAETVLVKNENCQTTASRSEKNSFGLSPSSDHGLLGRNDKVPFGLGENRSFFDPDVARHEREDSIFRENEGSSFITSMPPNPLHGSPAQGVFIVRGIGVDDSDGEPDGGLSRARCSAFRADARQLKTEQQRHMMMDRAGLMMTGGQQWPRGGQSWSGQPCYVSSESRLHDTVENANTQPMVWVRDGHKMPFRMTERTGTMRPTLYADPPQMYREDATCYSLNLPPQAHHCTCCQTHKPRLEPTLSSRHGMMNQTCQQQHPTAMTQPGNSFDGSHKLVESRHSLQAALDSACRMQGRKYRASRTLWPSSVCPNDREVSCSSASGLCGEAISRDVPRDHFWPLSELQSHQADLQRQARDFLDDLEPNIGSCRHRQGHGNSFQGPPTHHSSVFSLNNCTMATPVQVSRPTFQDITL